MNPRNRFSPPHCLAMMSALAEVHWSAIEDSGARRTGFRGEREKHSGMKANRTQTVIPAGRRTVFARSRNGSRDGRNDFDECDRRWTSHRHNEPQIDPYVNFGIIHPT